MKKVLILLATVLVATSSLNADEYSYDKEFDFLMISEKKDGFIPDETAAINIAFFYLTHFYGNGIAEESPFDAKLKDGIWYVKSTKPNENGGVSYIKIRKSDGAVLGIVHTK